MEPTERHVQVARTLHLTIKSHWFDLIASGEKVFEYREYKPYWISRLLCKSGTRNFTDVLFRNGYGPNRPAIRVEFLGMAIIKGRDCSPDNGEELLEEKKYFVIGLGNILEDGRNLMHSAY